MKNYNWVKPYKYVNVPIYLISFWKFRLFKIGSKRRRVGIKITKPKVWELYEQLIEGLVK